MVDFQVSGPPSLTLGPGTQGTANLTVTASTYYSGSINATCTVSSLPGSTCAVTPVSPGAISAGSTVPLLAAVNLPANVAPETYSVNFNIHDVSGAPSHPLAISLTVQDFAVSSSTASQSITAGASTGSYNLTVQPVTTSFNSAITPAGQTTSGAYQLSVAPNPAGSSFPGAVSLSGPSGLPAGARCLFNPSTPVTPGSTAQSVVMTISTAAKQCESLPEFQSHLLRAVLAVAGNRDWLEYGGYSLPKAEGASAGRNDAASADLVVAFLGGVSNGGTTPPPAGKQPVTYQITVTGTSSGTAADAGQSAVVTLVVD